MRSIRKFLPLVVGAAVLVGVATAATRSTNLTLVAYSTPKEAYGKIIPAFQATSAGHDVSFTQSYGPSADQSRAVLNGLPADVVEFSLQPDVQRLVKAGLVASNWNKNAYKGMVTDSVVVIAVRQGNPKHIRGWNDLTKQGVEVITPNPFTSGGARWNVMAAYGAQIKAGKNQKQAVNFLIKLFKNVSVQDKSAREALQTFAQGKGDAMLAYENEAILAKKKGVPLQYIVPSSTILIENPAAAVRESKHIQQAKAFVRFLTSPTAQKLFGENGYRPVVKSVARQFHFPKPAQLFKIDAFGGWTKAQQQFFDRTSGIMVKVEKAAKH